MEERGFFADCVFSVLFSPLLHYMEAYWPVDTASVSTPYSAKIQYFEAW